MSPRTNPYSREELLACAQRELAMRRAVYPGRVAAGKMTQTNATHETDAMEAIAAVLESYPLASPAREAVRIVCDDLAEREGFRDVVGKIGPQGWKEIRAFLVEKLTRTVVYVEPVKPAQTMDLQFS